MKANLVGTVIILSLIVWIPVSCCVSYQDRKVKRREAEESKWLSANVSVRVWEVCVHVCMRVCACVGGVRARVYACVCVCGRCACTCVCVCACVGEVCVLLRVLRGAQAGVSANECVRSVRGCVWWRCVHVCVRAWCELCGRGMLACVDGKNACACVGVGVAARCDCANSSSLHVPGRASIARTHQRL